MTTQLLNYNSGDQLSARPFLTWRTVQPAVWLVGTSDLAQNDNSKKSGSSKEISFNKLNGEYDDYTFVLNTLALSKNVRNFWPELNSRNFLSSPDIPPEQPPDFQEA